MKLIALVLVILTVLCAGQSLTSGLPDSSLRAYAQTVISPRLYAVRLKGKKVIVTGRDFSDGATIHINNEAVSTRNDSESPTTRLTAKKGGKKIPLDSIARIYIENPTTVEDPITPLHSESLAYFRTQSFFSLVLPRVNTYPVTLQVGDYFFVEDLETATRWFVNENSIVRVFDVQLPSDAFWSFQAFQGGNAVFYAEVYHGGGQPYILYNQVIFVE